MDELVNKMRGQFQIVRELDGILPEYGGPHHNPHGGLVICPWMVEMGYKDLR